MPIRLKLPLAVLVVALACMGVSVNASEAAVTVANTNDSGAGSLREAIEKAPAGETINLPAGEYNLTSEELFIGKSLTIAGAGAGSTKIGARNAFRVLDIETEGSKPPLSVSLLGLTIHQGAGLEEMEGETASGGGITAFNTNLTLNGVVISENRAEAEGDEEGGEAEGGGLVVYLGSLNMQDSTVTGNLAKAEGGEEEEGGVAEGGGMVVVGRMTMTNSTVSSNTALAGGSRGPGGAEGEGGRAEGAGLAMISGEGATKISDSTFARNSATAGNGKDGSPGEAVGGAMYVTVGLGGPAGEAMSIANSTVADNSASAPTGDAAGAGAVLGAVNGGSISMTGATLAANKLESKTGLVEPGFEDGGGNLVVVDEAPKVFAPGNISIGGSIVSGGVSTSSHPNCYVIGKVTSIGYNLDSRDECEFHGTADQVNADPLLAPLAANGGPTETMVPAAGSPAIDKSTSFGIGTDQRGIARPIAFPSVADAAGGDGSDIGAVEVQPLGSLKLGKVAKNKKKGTATVTVTPAAPALGSLTLKGKGLKTQKAKIGSKPTIKLKLVSKGGKAKTLRKKGSLKVKFEVIYTPSGVASVKKKGSTKLVLKAKPKGHKHGKR